VEIVAKSQGARPGAGRSDAPDPKRPRLEIHARDESGSPVKDFEAQLYSLSNASHEAAIGTDGIAVMAGDEVKSWKYGDLIVYWNVVLPQPATVELSLKSPGDAAGKPPFAAAYFSLLPIIPGQADGMLGLLSGELKEPEWRTTLKRLAPRKYAVYVQTTPGGATGPRSGLEARPGVYRDRCNIVLKPGERAAIAFEPPPFNPDAWRGKRSAMVLIRPAGNRPFGGEKYHVSYMLPTHGQLLVAESTLGPDGRIALEDIAPRGKGPFDGQYMVEIEGENLGKFGVKDQPGRQEFSFRMPLRAGDLAEVGEAQDLESGRPVRIADLRGRVVFLEFWATWCGPCQEPMQRLVELGKRRGESWRAHVALVAVGIDDDREVVRRYVRQNGLSTVRRLWSPQDQSQKAGSMYGAYSISGVPTASLIGRDGLIVWRGHPASIELERKIEGLIGCVR